MKLNDLDNRSRTWCLTINNYTPENIETLKCLKTVYIIVGDEIGENKTPHLQIYFRKKSQTKFSSIKKLFPTAHIEVAKGTDLQNREYCSKQSILYEAGEMCQQGKRTDIELVRDQVLDGENMRSITLSARSVQSVRMAEITLKYHENKRNWKPTVLWYYGATGTGKTFQAHQKSTDPYVSMDTGHWWEGYDGHSHVIIDDMRKDFMKFHQLLKLLDRYPYQVECKGGSRQFLAKQIIITSCYHPECLFETREDINQLLRRIDEIIFFGDNITCQESSEEESDASASNDELIIGDPVTTIENVIQSRREL